MSKRKSREKKEKQLSIRERYALLRYLLHIAWQEKKGLILWRLLGILPNAVLTFIPIVFPKLIIDELLGQRRAKMLAAWILIMISSELALRFLFRYTEFKTSIADEWFDNYIERTISMKIMKIKFALLENPKAMDQYQKARDGFLYSGGIYELLSNLTEFLTAMITMIGVIGIVSTASPFLLLLSILTVIISLALNAKSLNVRLHYYNLMPKINRVMDYVFFNLANFSYGKDIRLYSGMPLLQQMGTDVINKDYAFNREKCNKLQRFGILGNLSESLKNAITYAYLGILAILGHITIGDFTMLMNAADSFTQNCKTLLHIVQILGNDLEMMHSYQVFMEYPEEPEEGKPIPKEAKQAPLLEFRNVSFRYPDTEEYILNHLNLTILPGEHICVVGENGAGKSTFIKLLCRLYPVTEGDIFLNGTSIYSYSYNEYLKLLSVVFQDFKLFSFCIRDNLLPAGKHEPLSDEQLREICEMAGFKERLAQLPKGLDTGLYKDFYEDGIEPSGGEAQKLAIARALCKNAPIVILDEPTAALDPLAEAEIYEHFQQMSKDKTAIFISHRLSSCQFCDRVIVFAQHGIAESGSHKELAQKPNGIYAAMFRAQAENYQ